MNFSVKDIEKMRSICNLANDVNKEAQQIIAYCENRELDILHELELKNLTYHQKARLAEELSKIRRERREAKNQVYILESFMEWKQKNYKAITDLSSVIGKMRAATERQNKFIYKSRVDPNVIIEHFEE